MEEKIDLSDIPELGEEEFKRAKLRLPKKCQVCPVIPLLIKSNSLLNLWRNWHGKYFQGWEEEELELYSPEYKELIESGEVKKREE